MAREESGAGGPAFVGLDARAVQAALTRALADAGIDNAARDARLLVAAALGVTAGDLVKEPGQRLGVREAERLADFARRRAAREPVSRILGARGFFGRTFHITPATLDPRPCTETVVEAALDIAHREGWRERPVRILDVGTGSGVLLVTLLAELPLATGVGTDISDAALDVARANAERHGVAPRAEFLNRRTLDGIEGTFDMMVSNPPYIPTGDIAALEPEVRDYDPRGALDGGADGLDLYHALAAGLLRVVPEGWTVVEVGAGQADAVARLLSQAAGPALVEVRLWMDLGQHTRCVAVRTQPYPSH